MPDPIKVAYWRGCVSRGFKLPGGAQDEVRAIYKHAEEHNEEFNLYIKGEEGELADEPDIEKGAERATSPANAEGK